MRQIALWICGGFVAALAGWVMVATTGQKADAPLVTYQTSLQGRDANQVHNARLSAKELDGQVILPGQTFSFNEVVKGWSRDKGYRRAPVSYDGRLIDAWGGGVCQTSTTLYNAALVAGLEIVERHPHHYAPSYITPGRDAAVAYPNIDLRIKNTTSFPITIQTRIGDMLEVRLDGPGKITLAKVSERVEAATRPQEFTFGSSGASRVTNPGKWGYRVMVTREMGDQKEVVSLDQYPVMHRVVTRSGPNR